MLTAIKYSQNYLRAKKKRNPLTWFQSMKGKILEQFLAENVFLEIKTVEDD